jgi:hypothetical protein
MVKDALTPASNGEPGRITHYVTGDVLAYKHTAEVIGGVEGELIPLDVTTLAREQPAVVESQVAETPYRIV